MPIFALILGCTSPPMELIHDPSQLVLREDGALTLASSGTDGVGLQLWLVDPETGEFAWSADLFVDEKPDWASEVQVWNPTGEFDAPAMPEEGVLYYTVFDEGEDGVEDVIGRVHWDGDAWVDDGVIVRSQGEGDHPRAMDPSVFVDLEAQPWMVFGSHAGGVFVAALDADTGRLATRPDEPWCDDEDDARFTHVASSGEGAEENTIEAPYIFPHDGWYYLFVNWGACCRGVDSTYEIRMGRSESPDGPFRDVDGVDLADGGGTMFLGSQGNQIGPGHAGVVALEDAGSESFLLSYHYYDADDNGIAKLGLRDVTWASGWPVAGAVIGE